MGRRLFFVSFISIVLMLGVVFTPTPQAVEAQASCSTTSSFGNVTKSVTAPASSTYTAWVRLWVPSGANGSVKLSANTICKDVQVPSSKGSWVWTQKDSGGANMTTSLTNGQSYNVVLSGQAAGVRVDRVLLLSDGCTPSGTGDNCTTTDTTAPTINLTQPANGSTVSGNVATTYNISDTGDTAKVELLVDSKSVATNTNSPFGITWDSRSVADGSHTLQARLTDKDGNNSVSQTITVSVDNVDDDSEVSRIPVESYKTGGEGVGYHDTTDGNSGDGDCRPGDNVDMKQGVAGCVISHFVTGEWLEYEVNIEKAGNYTFQASVGSNDSDGGGKFRLEVDGNNVSQTMTAPNTGSYEVFTTVSKTVTLPSGKHSLRLHNEEQYFDVAWLQFVGPGTVSVGEVVTPPPPSDVISTISLDDYNSGGEGSGYHDTTSGNLGDGNCRQGDNVDMKAASDGCIISHFATGEWLKYDVNISKAGTYNFQVNTARGESGSGRFRLEVDGNNASGAVNVPSTGNWDTFSVVNASVTLPAGQHTLTFFNEQQYFDAEWMKFVGPGTITLTSTPPPPPGEDNDPPSTPANLKASNVGQNTVTLTWNESVDSGTGVVGYAVYRDGQFLEMVISTSYTDSNLQPGANYQYQVSAWDGNENESSKASLTVKTEAEPKPPVDDGPSADLNNDGAFTIADLAIYKTWYKANNSKADFNGDGKVTVHDWAKFLAAWKAGR